MEAFKIEVNKEESDPFILNDLDFKLFTKLACLDKKVFLYFVCLLNYCK